MGLIGTCRLHEVERMNEEMNRMNDGDEVGRGDSRVPSYLLIASPVYSRDRERPPQRNAGLGTWIWRQIWNSAAHCLLLA